MKIDFDEYNLIHTWLRSKYGSAYRCTNIACKNTSTHYEWALKKNHMYIKDVNNYIQLCRTCHREYDKNNKKWERGNKNIQIRVSPYAQKKLRIYAAKTGKYIIDIIDELTANLKVL